MRKLYDYNPEYASDTPKAFYLLGLIASDGVIDGYHAKIGLKDKDLLEVIRDDLVPNKPLYYNKRDDTWYLKISNKQILRFILSAGITAHKSLTLKLEDWVLQSNNFPNFIRGYFDGDGTIGIARNTNGKSKKNYYRACMRIGSASRDIIEQMQNFLTTVYSLNKNNITCEKREHISMYYLKFIGSQAQKFYDIIYDDSGIKLERKYKRYTIILSLDSAELSQYHGKGHEGMTEIDKLAL
jgi:hypothetical protein